MDNSVEKFHRSRVMFALVNGKLEVATHDARGHHEWLTEDYGISDKEFGRIPRGYIKDNKVQLYKGLAFAKIEEKDELNLIIDEIARYISNEAYSGVYTIYNGVEVGKPGEEWKPQEICGKIHASI